MMIGVEDGLSELKLSDESAGLAEERGNAGLRSNDEAFAECADEMDFDLAEEIVLQREKIELEDGQELMVWEGPSEEAIEYLSAVDKLQETSISKNEDPSVVERARSALRISTARLKEEFKHLLAIHSECVDSSWIPDCFSAASFSSNVDPAEEDGENAEQSAAAAEAKSQRDESPIIDLLPPGVVADLFEIGDRLVVLGAAADCRDVYVSVRKGVLEDSMFLLGVEKVSKEELQKMPWDQLEPRVKKWNKAIKVSIKVLFASERALCDDVFQGHPQESDACFEEVATTAILQLLTNLKEVAALSRGSPEKIFKLLDMYEVLKDLLPEIQHIFQFSDVPDEAAQVVNYLGEAVRSTFVEFKNAIEKDSTRAAVAGGAVHPLTRYVMNYMLLLCDYLDTLKELYGHKERDDDDDDDDDDGGIGMGMGIDSREDVMNGSGGDDGNGKGASALEAEMMVVVNALMSSLEEKSKLYKDPALSHIFLMNNIHYIVQKVKSSDVQSVIGDVWVRKHSSLVRYYAMNYQRVGWGKVFSFVRDEGIRITGYNVSTDVLKERFKNFNAAFEEIHKAQSTWIVPELKLRDELRLLIADKLLPAYRSFLGRYRRHLEEIRHSERYLKYSSDDIENYLNDLFEGTSGSMNRRRSFSTSA